jgi:hypothetical protein
MRLVTLIPFARMCFSGRGEEEIKTRSKY